MSEGLLDSLQVTPWRPAGLENECFRVKDAFCRLEQDTTVERTAAALQLQPRSGAGLGPGAVLSVSPGR